ncbi:hypothetical protein QQX98_005288 [Neonectria punicea]|uniref:Uncharacterized protein n=1 Tax=Neonectria punicea TaxID=979145 RepID=A0ABR1H631_9HYPO
MPQTNYRWHQGVLSSILCHALSVRLATLALKVTMQTKQESQVSALALKVDSSVQNVWMAGSVLHEKHQRSQSRAVLDGRAITGLMEAKSPTTEQFLQLARALKLDQLRPTMQALERTLLLLVTHQPLVNRKLLVNHRLLLNHQLLVSHRLQVNHKLLFNHKFLVKLKLLVSQKLLVKFNLLKLPVSRKLLLNHKLPSNHKFLVNYQLPVNHQLPVSQKLLTKFNLLKLPANHKLPVSPKPPANHKPLVNHRSLIRVQSQTSQFQTMDLALDLAQLLTKAHPRLLHKLLGQQSLQAATLDPAWYQYPSSIRFLSPYQFLPRCQFRLKSRFRYYKTQEQARLPEALSFLAMAQLLVIVLAQLSFRLRKANLAACRLTGNQLLQTGAIWAVSKMVFHEPYLALDLKII